jgi:RNA polymerase sigma factor (sigma-70 family)
MSDAKDRPTEPVPIEQLLEQAKVLLPRIIQAAFRRLNYPASPDDIERCEERVMVMLWDGNRYKPLHEFRGRASLPTYLFPIAYHEVIRFLKEKGRNVPLEALPQELIELPPDQYELVLGKERRHKLDQMASEKLTEHQQKLLAMKRAGMTTAEIARELGITKATVAEEMSRLLKKLRGLMEE